MEEDQNDNEYEVLLQKAEASIRTQISVTLPPLSPPYNPLQNQHQLKILLESAQQSLTLSERENNKVINSINLKMKTAENRNLRVIESLREEQKAKIIKIQALQKQVAELTKTKDHQKQSIHSLQLQLKSLGKSLTLPTDFFH